MSLDTLWNFEKSELGGVYRGKRADILLEKHDKIDAGIDEFDFECWNQFRPCLKIQTLLRIKTIIATRGAHPFLLLL